MHANAIAVIPHFGSSCLCFVGISVKKEVTKPSRCMSDLLCHKGGLDCSDNREIKSTYLLQREATMGDI